MATRPGPNCGDVFTAEHAEIAEIILEAHGRRMPIVSCLTLKLMSNPSYVDSSRAGPGARCTSIVAPMISLVSSFTSLHLCALGGLSGE